MERSLVHIIENNQGADLNEITGEAIKNVRNEWETILKFLNNLFACFSI